MMTARRAVLGGLLLALSLASAPMPAAAPANAIPHRLADREFWRLIDELSEPEGYFNSDNLVSNEDTYQEVIPELVRTVAPGGVYVGVGPDQNFTYIAAVRPAMAFIPDVRRGNLQLHLMYKALFALSATRAEFLSRLFSRPIPAGLASDATARDLMEAFAAGTADPARFDANVRAVLDYLARHRRAALEDADRAGIEFVHGSFFSAGPDITFISNAGFRRARYPAWSALLAATDRDGVARSFLASETLFARVKALHERNMIVPLVGDFAGAMTIEAIGAWVRQHDARVTVFYTSNVEQYLFQDQAWDRFRRSVASMPLDATSTFIRSCFNSCSTPGGPRAVSLLDSITGLLDAAANGRVASYWDVLVHSRAPGP